MREPVKTPKDLGRIIKKVRQAQGVRQEDLALMVPASHVFIIDVERGKPTAQIGKVMALLSELGIELHVDTPDIPSTQPDA